MKILPTPKPVSVLTVSFDMGYDYYDYGYETRYNYVHVLSDVKSATKDTVEFDLDYMMSDPKVCLEILEKTLDTYGPRVYNMLLGEMENLNMIEDHINMLTHDNAEETLMIHAFKGLQYFPLDDNSELVLH